MSETTQIERIARVVHEANRAWAATMGVVQPAWDEAEEWYRSSTIEAVEFVLNHPDAPDSAQHDRWVDERTRQGWTWGPVRDENAKTNPALVAYAELPWEQRVKDLLRRAIVTALTEGA